MSNKLGQRIRSLRAERGMTQEALAKKLNTTKQSISNYEKGKRSPDYETLELLADTFNVDMGYLLGDTNKTTVLPNNESLIYSDENFRLFSNNRRLKPGADSLLGGQLRAMTEAKEESREYMISWLNENVLYASSSGQNYERMSDEELKAFYHEIRKETGN